MNLEHDVPTAERLFCARSMTVWVAMANPDTETEVLIDALTLWDQAAEALIAQYALRALSDDHRPTLSASSA